MKSKVVVIGLDGATLTLLEPWMEQGKLPNMAKLAREGSCGYLESTPEKLSPAAWTSFSTGVNPGRHGIFHFFTVDAGTLKVRINNATQRRVEPFWNLAGRAGKRVCVINVPVTYPADKINGCMISGWDAPSIQSKGFTCPPELIDEITNQFHDYPLAPSIKKFSSTQPDLAIEDLHRVLDLRIALSKYMLGKEDWDIFITVLTETDQAQHFFWHLTDKTHPLYSDDMIKKYGDAILGIYEKCDRFIGELMKDLGDDATVFIVSDHGAGTNCLGNQYLPVLLERTGFLRKKRNSARLTKTLITLKRKFIFKLFLLIGYDLKKKLKDILAKKFDVGLQSIIASYDWANTSAYPAGANLRINVKSREAYGIVSKGEEYDNIVNTLISTLKGCVDLKTGRPIIKDIVKKKDAYCGAYMDDAPDLILKWADDFVISGISCRMENGSQLKIPGLVLDTDDAEWTGDHADYGIFMAKGPHIKSGYNIHNPSIMDIAPSILYLMGIPVPEDWDGKVLTGIFKEEFLNENWLQTADTIEADKVTEKAYSDKEEDEIKNRLRDLGYLE